MASFVYGKVKKKPAGAVKVWTLFTGEKEEANSDLDVKIAGYYSLTLILP